MINGILILAGITLFIYLFIVIPELLRQKREAQSQKLEKDRPNSVIVEIPADVVAAGVCSFAFRCGKQGLAQNTVV
jgi:hypothetical protein